MYIRYTTTTTQYTTTRFENLSILSQFFERFFYFLPFSSDRNKNEVFFAFTVFTTDIKVYIKGLRMAVNNED